VRVKALYTAHHPQLGKNAREISIQKLVGNEKARDGQHARSCEALKTVAPNRLPLHGQMPLRQAPSHCN
jgi:hypothetical protein